MTKEELPKKVEEENLQLYKDLYYLKDETFYRQQTLVLLDRIAQAIENLAFNSSPEEEDKE